MPPLRKNRSRFVDSLSLIGAEAIHRLQKLRMHHPRSDKRPAICLKLLFKKRRALVGGKFASRGELERFEFEFGLLLQTGIQESADREEAVYTFLDLFVAQTLGNILHHARIELGVLRL